MVENFPYLVKKILTDPRISTTFQQNKHAHTNTNMPRHIAVTLLRAKDKEKSSKEASKLRTRVQQYSS